MSRRRAPTAPGRPGPAGRADRRRAARRPTSTGAASSARSPATPFQTAATVVGRRRGAPARRPQRGGERRILDPDAPAPPAGGRAGAGRRRRRRAASAAPFRIERRPPRPPRPAPPARRARRGRVCESAGEVAQAIREMVVRGAPALGQVAAYGLALAAGRATTHEAVRPPGDPPRHGATRSSTRRPTAVTIRWAVDRMLARYAAVGELLDDGAGDRRRRCAPRPTRSSPRRRCDHGRLAEPRCRPAAAPDGRPLQLLTHCNTGPLACGQSGRRSASSRRSPPTAATSTSTSTRRGPSSQGARLTAWELGAGRRPAHAHRRRGGRLAPRRAATSTPSSSAPTGSRPTATSPNKVGHVPAGRPRRPPRRPVLRRAPRPRRSTPTTPDGAAIPIEMRGAGRGHSRSRGRRVAPAGTAAVNPAFDVTPAELITGDRHRGGRPPGAVRAGDRRARSPIARPAARRPRRRARVRDPPSRSRGPADGDDRRRLAPVARTLAVRPTTDRAAAARVPRARPALRRLRASATSTTASSPGPAGASRSRATSRSRSSSSTAGYAPQPLFVMGERGRDRGDPARRHPAPRRLRRRAARRACPAVERALPRGARARRWSGCGSTAHRSARTRRTSRRLLPVEIGDLNRLYQLGFTSWLPPSAIAEGVYYGIRVERPPRGRRRHARRQPEARLASSATS